MLGFFLNISSLSFLPLQLLRQNINTQKMVNGVFNLVDLTQENLMIFDFRKSLTPAFLVEYLKNLLVVKIW